MWYAVVAALYLGAVVPSPPLLLLLRCFPAGAARAWNACLALFSALGVLHHYGLFGGSGHGSDQQLRAVRKGCDISTEEATLGLGKGMRRPRCARTAACR